MINDFAKFFKDRKVWLIGPASSLKDDAHLTDIKDEDLIVKLNHHWKFECPGIPDRVDFIVHCTNYDLYSVGDLKKMKERNIKIIIRNPFDLPDDKSREFLKRNAKAGAEAYDIELEFMLDMRKRLKTNPSTGIVAIVALLKTGLKSLNCIGLDFYESLYVHKDNDKLRQQYQKGGQHSNSKQIPFLKDLYKTEKRFVCYGKMKEILEAP